MRSKELNRDNMTQSEKVTEDLFQLKAILGMYLTGTDNMEVTELKMRTAQVKVLLDMSIDELIQLSYTVNK